MRKPLPTSTLNVGCFVSPEIRLWHGVLEDAILCYLGMGTTQRDSQRETDFLISQDWFISRFQNPPPGSFEWICECLGYDPDYIFSVVKRWKATCPELKPTSGMYVAHMDPDEDRRKKRLEDKPKFIDPGISVSEKDFLRYRDNRDITL